MPANRLQHGPSNVLVDAPMNCTVCQKQRCLGTCDACLRRFVEAMCIQNDGLRLEVAFLKSQLENFAGALKVAQAGLKEQRLTASAAFIGRLLGGA